jgi:hypothetical protein
MQAHSPEIPHLLEVLAAHQVRFILTGSVAVQAYGVEIGVPGDLDITPALDRANLERLSGALLALDAHLDLEGPAGHWEVQANGEWKWAVDEITAELLARRRAWSPDPTRHFHAGSLFPDPFWPPGCGA